MNGKTRLSCVIIDDEAPAHQVLKFHLDKIPWLQFAGSIYSSVDAVSSIPFLNPDIIFLDVSMPNLSGLQLLDILQLSKTRIILTSAHASFAVDGYQYEVTYFLLKPVTFEKLLKAVTIARGNHHTDPVGTPRINEPGIVSDPTPLLSTEEPDVHYHNQEALWVKVEKTMLRIDYSQISLFEGQKNYVKIVYDETKDVITRLSLAELEKKLPSTLFVRTHKSYIVNRHQIQQIDGNQITLKNSYRVSISPQERNTVLRLLTNSND